MLTSVYCEVHKIVKNVCTHLFVCAYWSDHRNTPAGNMPHTLLLSSFIVTIRHHCSPRADSKWHLQSFLKTPAARIALLGQGQNFTFRDVSGHSLSLARELGFFRALRSISQSIPEGSGILLECLLIIIRGFDYEKAESSIRKHFIKIDD